MQSKPISEAVRKNFLPTIQLIATDMDGTLTQGGKFSKTRKNPPLQISD